MGLLLIDGFETTLSHWEQGGYQPGYVANNLSRRSGFRGANFTGIASSIWIPLAYPTGLYPARITLGVAHRRTAFDGLGGTAAFGLNDYTGTRLVSVHHHSMGSLYCALGNGTPLFYTSKTWIRPDTWHYIELDFIPGSPGSIELRVNGQTEGSWTGQTGTTGIGYFVGGPTSSGYYMDDLYVADDGVFRGDCAVDMLHPDGATAQTDFTAVPAAPNYLRVAETTSDDDVSYVQSATPSAKDLYTFSATEFDGSIFGVQVLYNARKSTAGPRSVRSLLKSGGVTEPGATSYPSFPSWQYRWDPWTTKPGGGSWTYADVNALEAGAEVVT